MSIEERMIECPDCEGEGTQYEDTSHQCSVVPSECCGGCGYDYECENCKGEGKIEKDD